MLSNSLFLSLPFVIANTITLCLGLTLAAIAAIDLKTFRIPDVLSLPLIGAGLALALAIPGVYFTDHLIGALAALTLFAGIGELYFRARNVDGLGLGDAKLYAAAGAWLG